MNLTKVKWFNENEVFGHHSIVTVCFGIWQNQMEEEAYLSAPSILPVLNYKIKSCFIWNTQQISLLFNLI
jgi:hypothetical protein